MSQPKKPKDSRFALAVDAAQFLHLRAGLEAIKRGEGRGRISAADPRRVTGSVMIDEDCNHKPHQSAPRWDYAIGYARRGSGAEEVVFFVEVHTASAGGVTEVGKKLRWLLDFLGESAQRQLASLPREIHWVASGKHAIPKNSPQARFLSVNLKKLGLSGPHKTLQVA